MSEDGQLQDFSVDQAAGAVVLVLGAVAGLLQVIWMSKCHCRVNLCYLFTCERRPPSEEEMKTLKDKVNKATDNNKANKDNTVSTKDKKPIHTNSMVDATDNPPIEDLETQP
tara:strand:+ start:1127 stop:1462 length:336 start_codon:yes stop_codon:yes gene_type:complete